MDDASILLHKEESCKLLMEADRFLLCAAIVGDDACEIFFEGGKPVPSFGRGVMCAHREFVEPKIMAHMILAVLSRYPETREALEKLEKSREVT